MVDALAVENGGTRLFLEGVQLNAPVGAVFDPGDSGLARRQERVRCRSIGRKVRQMPPVAVAF